VRSMISRDGYRFLTVQWELFSKNFHAMTCCTRQLARIAALNRDTYISVVCFPE